MTISQGINDNLVKLLLTRENAPTVLNISDDRLNDILALQSNRMSLNSKLDLTLALRNEVAIKESNLLRLVDMNSLHIHHNNFKFQYRFPYALSATQLF